MKVVQNSVRYIAVSVFFLLISLGFLFFTKLNLGIDMTGGIQMDFDHKAEINLTEVQEKVHTEAMNFKHNNTNVINDTSAYRVTGEKTISVVVGFHNNIEEKELEILKEDFRKITFDILESQDSEVIESKYVNI